MEGAPAIAESAARAWWPYGPRSRSIPMRKLIALALSVMALASFPGAANARDWDHDGWNRHSRDRDNDRGWPNRYARLRYRGYAYAYPYRYAYPRSRTVMSVGYPGYG